MLPLLSWGLSIFTFFPGCPFPSLEESFPSAPGPSTLLSSQMLQTCTAFPKLPQEGSSLGVRVAWGLGNLA